MEPNGKPAAPAPAQLASLNAAVRALEAAWTERPRGDPDVDEQWCAEMLVAGFERIFVRYLH